MELHRARRVARCSMFISDGNRKWLRAAFCTPSRYLVSHYNRFTAEEMKRLGRDVKLLTVEKKE